MSEQELRGYLFLGAIVLVVLGLARLLAPLGEKSERKRAGWVQCDLCDELMRPDGLHITVNHSLFFLGPDRMHRHNLHIIREMVRKREQEAK